MRPNVRRADRAEGRGATEREGHWVMFIIGFFLPFFWLIGALMPSRRLAY